MRRHALGLLLTAIVIAGAGCQQGPKGDTGAAGPKGPKGDPGTVASLNALDGKPCTRDGASGAVQLSFDANGVATIRCVLGVPRLLGIDVQSCLLAGFAQGPSAAVVLEKITPMPVTVALQSSRPDLIQVPATVQIRAGDLQGDFQIGAKGSEILLARGTTATVTITAELNDLKVEVQRIVDPFCVPSR